MAVIITGATGYLGSELVRTLRSKDLDVHTVSRAEAERLIYGLRHASGGEKEMQSLRVVNDLTGSTVFHFAGLDRRNCNERPWDALRINSSGTYKVLREYIERGAKKIMWISTIGSICEEEELILDGCREDYYVKSKRLGEALVNMIRLKKGQSIHIVRLANVFGANLYPLERGSLLVGNCFCSQGIKTDQIVVKSELEKRLSFVPLHKFLEQCELLVSENTDVGGISVRELRGETMTLLEFADTVRQRVKRILGRDVEIFHEGEGVSCSGEQREVDLSVINEIDNIMKLAYLSSYERQA